MGVWPVLPVSAQCAGAWLEPQTGLPRAGTEPADQTQEAFETRQAQRLVSAGEPEPGLVDGRHGRPVEGWQGVPSADGAG